MAMTVDKVKLYFVIQAGTDIGTVQEAAKCNLLIPDCPVMRICPCEMMSSFFSLKHAKTCNSWFHA